MEEEKQERSFELRSEKVRSIVGQVPSSLTCYGITAIGIVLLCLFVMAYFLPYKQVYSGTAIIQEATITTSDSTDITILLRFENKQPVNVNRQILYLQTSNGTSVGTIRKLSAVRDTLARQETLCRFKTTEIQPLQNQTVDFKLVVSSSSLLQKLLGNFCL